MCTLKHTSLSQRSQNGHFISALRYVFIFLSHFVAMIHRPFEETSRYLTGKKKFAHLTHQTMTILPCQPHEADIINAVTTL